MCRSIYERELVFRDYRFANHVVMCDIYKGQDWRFYL